MTPTVITPEMCRLDAFDALPNLVYCINDPPIDCLRKLATADVLVMSRSSFSYVGAILNKTGIVMYHPFWHSALSSWLTVDADGHFDRSRFDERLEKHRGSPEDLRTGASLPDHGGDPQADMVTLPPNRYMPLGRMADTMLPDGQEEAFPAEMICLSGWRACGELGCGGGWPGGDSAFPCRRAGRHHHSPGHAGDYRRQRALLHPDHLGFRKPDGACAGGRVGRAGYPVVRGRAGQSGHCPPFDGAVR
jgi:hypothetical protein